jgi:hypothetical protein
MKGAKRLAYSLGKRVLECASAVNHVLVPALIGQCYPAETNVTKLLPQLT